MQVKTIDKNIRAKLEEWLLTITDEALRTLVKDNLLVSGGSIASMLMNEPVNDYDVYLMDMDVCKKIAQYYTKPFGNVIIFDGRERQAIVDKYNDEFESKAKARGYSEAIDMNNSYSISLRNLKEDQIKLYFDGARGGLKVNEDVKNKERIKQSALDKLTQEERDVLGI